MAGKKKSLAYALLTLLEGAVDGMALVNDFANNPGNYSLLGRDYPLKKSYLSQALRRLKEKGFVQSEKNEGKIIFKLTQTGQDFLLLSKTDDEVEWDKKWRLVIFDIPENKRGIRDILRSRLKLWGFTPWQKSVWASKKNITEKLRSFVKELGIEEWVLVIESDNVK